MNQRANMQLWKMRKSQVDSHRQHHCSVVELKLIGDSTITMDGGGYKFPIQWRRR